MTERERGEEDDEEGCYTAKVLRFMWNVHC